jgi:hypothetical protein
MAASGIEAFAAIAGRGIATLDQRFTQAGTIPYFGDLGRIFPASLVTHPAIGPRLQSLVTAGTAVRNAASALDAGGGDGIPALVAGLGVTIAAAAKALDELGDALTANADSFPPMVGDDVRAFATGLSERVLSDLVIRQLERERPQTLAWLVLLGTIEHRDQPVDFTDPTRWPSVLRQFSLSRLISFFRSPVSYLDDVFWGSAGFSAAGKELRDIDRLRSRGSTRIADRDQTVPGGNRMEAIWTTETELSGLEERIAKRCGKRRVFVFLRELRHRIFDRGMQERLNAAYKETVRGKERVPPAQLAMALLLQAALDVPDHEVVYPFGLTRR